MLQHPLDAPQALSGPDSDGWQGISPAVAPQRPKQGLLTDGFENHVMRDPPDQRLGMANLATRRSYW